MRSHVTVHGAAATSGLAIALFLLVTDLALAGIWFDDPLSYTVPKTPSRLVVGHFNADAHLDVVVGAATGDSESAYIYLNDGAGGLTLDATLAVSTSWEALAVGDFNGDGRDDIAVSDSPTKVYYADANHEYPGPAVTVPLTGSTFTYFGKMVATDMDGDGYCDLVGRLGNSGPQPPYIRVVWGSAAGLMPGNTEIVIDLFGSESCPSSVIDLVAADADGDDDLDLVVSATHETAGSGCSPNMRGIGVVWCDGPRNYRETEQWILSELVSAPVDAYYSPLAEPLGGQSSPDLLFLDGVVNKVMYGEEAGEWRSPEPSGLSPVPAQVFDINGDGIQDAVQLHGGTVRVRRGLPTSGFEVVESMAVPLFVAAEGDIEGDGRPDAIAFGGNPDRVCILRNIAPTPVDVQSPIANWQCRVNPTVTAKQPVRIEWLGGSNGDSEGKGTPRGGSPRVSVRDVQGRVVWRSAVSPAADGGAWWNLTDSRGETVPAGVYFVGLDGIALRGSAKVCVVR